MTTAVPRDTRNKGISKADVAAAAAALVDEAGVEQLSMRKVAARLGVTPMALYNHVRDKDDLLELTAEHVRGQVVVDETLPAHEQLLSLLTQMCVLGARHPRLLDSAATSSSPGAARPSAQVVRLLADLGLAPGQVRSTYNALAMLLLGAAQLQRLADSRPETARRAETTLAATASRDDDGLIEAIVQLPRITVVDELRTGVELVLRAVRQDTGGGPRTRTRGSVT